MLNDPIVDEVRRAAKKIMAKTDYDPIRYIRRLQRNQGKSGHKLVDLSTEKNAKKTLKN